MLLVLFNTTKKKSLKIYSMSIFIINIVAQTNNISVIIIEDIIKLLYKKKRRIVLLYQK